MPYIKIKDNILAIDLALWNKIEFYNQFGTLILFFFSLLILLGGALLQQKSLYSVIFSILLLFKFSLPYRYAKRLQELIEKYNSNKALQRTSVPAGR